MRNRFFSDSHEDNACVDVPSSSWFGNSPAHLRSLERRFIVQVQDLVAIGDSDSVNRKRLSRSRGYFAHRESRRRGYIIYHSSSSVENSEQATACTKYF